jgi:hypothetical protein
LTVLAFRPDITLHHFHKAFRDREAESCTAVLSSCGSVRLAECLKQVRDLLRRHPDAAVVDRKFQFCPIGAPLFEVDSDYNLAAFRKFHCVVYEVD